MTTWAALKLIFADSLLAAVIVGDLIFIWTLATDRESWSQYFQTTLLAMVLSVALLAGVVWVLCLNVR